MNLLQVRLVKPNNITQDRSKTAATITPAEKQAVRVMESISASPIATTALKLPDRPQNSRLVTDPVYMEPVNFVSDIKENIVNIGKGVSGHSNDHDLGRINDFAMRAGALGLAGYLFIKAKTPMTKLMEFIGFGSFFASMSLWPKLFIEKPLHAMYGVNLRQKYIDNQGRKKSFFQDPQYIPWDLYSDDEISKMGDKLGVPRGIHNRNEVIRRKAQKIALQGNTLWMLTAGFATPIMSALICSGAEKLISPQMEKLRIKKAENNLRNIDKVTEKAMIKYNPKKLYAVMDVAMNRELNTEIFGLLVDSLKHGTDVLEKEAIVAQLDEILSTNKDNATKEYAERFLTYLKKHAPQPQRFEMSEALKSQIFALADGNNSQMIFHEKAKRLLRENGFDNRDINKFIELTNKFRQLQSNISVRILTPEKAELIKNLDKTLYEFSVRKSVIDNYRNVYLGDVAESYAANVWTRISQKMVKALGIKDGELKFARLEGPESFNLLMKKLEALASDESAYKKAISEIQSEILKFDMTILPDTKDGASQGVRAILDEAYINLIDKYAGKFRELGFESIVERLAGNGNTDLGSLRANLNDKTFRRTWELRNGFYKILHVFDCFKRAADAEKGWDSSAFAKLYRDLSVNHGGVDLHPTAETFKNDLKLFKEIVLGSTIADNTVKFGYNNAQFALYDRMMKLIYNTDFDKATLEALKDETLGDTTFIASFKKKILDTLSNLGNFSYPHAEKVTTRGVNGWVGDILVRDSLQADGLDKVFRKAASSMYNSRKWLKMFGGAGVVLVALTLLAQTAFGKIPNREVFMRKEAK